MPELPCDAPALRRFFALTLAAVGLLPGGGAAAQGLGDAVLLRPSAVYDGGSGAPVAGLVVLVRDGRIVQVGEASAISSADRARVVELPGLTLMPGLIEGHSHLLLYPYDQMPWTTQVLNESQGLRTARATVNAAATLHAGVTSARDLGSEGAGYADVGIRDAIDQGVIEGPRLWVAGPAIVATGSYNPKGAPELLLPLGAEPADGVDDLIRVVRDQIGRGADWVKVYADYRWGPDGSAQPTFTQRELDTIVEVAGSSGRPVVAHASFVNADGARASDPKNPHLSPDQQALHPGE